MALVDLLADPACRALATLGSRALRSQRWVAHFDESHFCSIFFGIVDELAIIPVASWDIVTLDGDGRSPSSATTFRIRQPMF